MNIDFYEEYPSKDTLDKLKLIDFNSKIFISAKSLKEFKEIEKQAKTINKKIECAYWPIVDNSYWISPFSNHKDLVKLFKELNSCKNDFLIDLELPLKKILILKNILSFSKNKKLIKKFMERNKKKIMTAEVPFPKLSHILKLIGLEYNVNVRKSPMWYSSMIPNIFNKKIKKNLAKFKRKENYSIGVGTIAMGILGNEPISPPKNLESDLNFLKKSGFNSAIVFRLGGLNQEYMKSIKKFI